MAHAQTSSAHMSTAIVAQPQPLSISKLNWLSSSQILVVTAVSRASISGTYADFPAKIIIDPNQSYSVLNVINQITAHKFQILDKSDEQRFVPQLPAGGTNDNENDKAGKTEDLLTTFSTKKRHRISSRIVY